MGHRPIIRSLGSRGKPLGGLLEAVLRHRGGSVGLSWGLFYTSWGRFGASWEAFGGLFGHLGGLLGPPVGLLGRKAWIFGLRSPSWASLGPSWGALEPSWAPLAPSSDSTGPSCFCDAHCAKCPMETAGLRSESFLLVFSIKGQLGRAKKQEKVAHRQAHRQWLLWHPPCPRSL